MSQNPTTSPCPGQIDACPQQPPNVPSTHCRLCSKCLDLSLATCLTPGVNLASAFLKWTRKNQGIGFGVHMTSGHPVWWLTCIIWAYRCRLGQPFELQGHWKAICHPFSSGAFVYWRGRKADVFINVAIILQTTLSFH